MKRILILILALAVSTLAQSHEFWLQPKKYRYQVGEEMIVDFRVGENFQGEFWNLQRHKVKRLEMVNRTATENLQNKVKETEGKNISFKFAKQGTHLLVMESNDAYIELEADKFNAYLKEDGLENILDERTKASTLDKASREYYSRFAKLLVQSGDIKDDVYKKNVGSRLEIIPDQNPYAITSGDYLQCQVLFEGKPNAHQLVKVWSFAGNRIFLQNIYTENDGTIKFPLSSKGPWMVSTVKMIHSEKEGADYRSLWASLVFEIQ